MYRSVFRVLLMAAPALLLSCQSSFAQGWVNVPPQYHVSNVPRDGGYCAFASASTAAMAAGYPQGGDLVTWQSQQLVRRCDQFGCRYERNGKARADLMDIQGALRARGVPATACNGPHCWGQVNQSMATGRPCVACYWVNNRGVSHCIVPQGVSGDRFFFFDPNRPGQVSSMPMAEWARRFNHHVITFAP
jgi:hypothetical protein